MKIKQVHQFSFLLAMIFACSFIAKAQSKFSVSGYVKDAANGETLIGAIVSVPEQKAGNATNGYGYYTVNLPAGQHRLKVSYLGYLTKEVTIDLKKNTVLDIELAEQGKTTEEVEVTASRPADNVKAVQMSVAKLDMKQISKIPALLGEVDVIRSIQLLPGVSTVGEGATGFNVRGGGVDQNLVLLDEAPVYNSSHLFGFFSVFNPDAVKDVKLYKGGIPAQYGGRLSSILDVRMKEGNSKRYSATAGIGTIFSRFAIEGPIKKDTASFIVAGRRSYGDVFLKLSPDATLRSSILYFYDLSAKANWRVNKKNQVFLSSYFGRDVFGLGSLFNFGWGNATTTLRWNSQLTDKLFLNSTAFYSNYDYSLGITDAQDGFVWNAALVNYSIKPDFTWYQREGLTVNFGGQSILHDVQPGKATFKAQGTETSRTLTSKYGWENALYVGVDQNVSERLSLQYGLRFSMYDLMGPGGQIVFSEQRDAINGRRTREDSLGFTAGQSIVKYLNPEPRFAAKYELSDDISLKGSYNRTTQYIHLISNSTSATPVDVYQPSSREIKPQIGDQYALGYFQNFGLNKDWEFSVEGFYKDMQNQVDYVDGARLILNPDLEGELLSGRGRAYGLELYLKKSTGNFQGWISYTLARTERLIDYINNGKWFPARFDRTHNLNVVMSYDWTGRKNKYSLGSTFTYTTGIPTTFPTNRIELDGIGLVPHNEGNARNTYRVPDYHRLDLAFTIYFPKKDGDKWYKRYEDNIVFSLYNVYNRRNPYSIYFERTPNTARETRAMQLAIFGSIIPSVTYNITF